MTVFSYKNDWLLLSFATGKLVYSRSPFKHFSLWIVSHLMTKTIMTNLQFFFFPTTILSSISFHKLSRGCTKFPNSRLILQTSAKRTHGVPNSTIKKPLKEIKEINGTNSNDIFIYIFNSVYYISVDHLCYYWKNSNILNSLVLYRLLTNKRL